jgi:hypothetical protein
MNWQSVTQARRQLQCRHQPRLDPLEDRTLLTATTFTLLPSSLSISDSRIVYGSLRIPITEQGPGSFSTTYTGTIATDIDPVGHTITFLNDGGAMTAHNSGDWQPDVGGGMGSAPANYGGQFDFLGANYAAIRDLVMGLTATPVPLTRIGGDPHNGIAMFSFPSTQTITIANGNFDFHTAQFGDDSQSAAGLYGSNQTTNGTVQANGDGTLTLTIPVDADILVYDLGNGDGAWIHFHGTFTGIGSLGTSPAISSFQIPSGNAVANDVLVGTLAKPEGLLSVSFSTSAEIILDSLQAHDNHRDGAMIPPAQVASALVLDVVFQDSVLGSEVSF